jgi:hypothetical protein
MEELLILVIQFLIEVVGEALLSIPFDCTCRVRDKPENPAVWPAFVLLVAGGLCGWVANRFVPPLIHVPALSVLSLIASPLLAGGIGYRIARFQTQRRNPLIEPKRHFWYSFAFTLGLASVRFAYAR